jgi:hypothetical protein
VKTEGIHSIPEVQAALEQAFNCIIDLIHHQPDVHFDHRFREEKWSAAEQLDHLIRSVKPLNQGMLLPKFIIGWIFGKRKRDEYSFGEIRDQYLQKLDTGYKASGRYIPGQRSTDAKVKMLERYDKEKTTLIKRLNSWTEEDVSAILLPHPVLGKVTVREMMFFTIYHTTHHLQQLKEIEGHEK